MADPARDTTDVVFLLQKIESIIDTRLIREAEPLPDEKARVQEHLNRKRDGPLELHEMEGLS
jgi:hypothetical protein